MQLRRWLVLFCAAIVAPASHAAEPHLATDLQKISYMVGLQVGQNITRQGFTELDVAAFALAVQDAIMSNPPRVSADDAKAAQAGYRAALIAKADQAAEKNMKDGADFLAANGKRDGVITLDSGVQYRVLTPGEGDSPTLENTIVAHYKGMLLTGQEFDSSYSRDEPLTFQLTGVISGWRQVVPRMKPGGKIEAWIPAEHAYGKRGSPPVIGPNSTLHFVIELIGVKGK